MELGKETMACNLEAERTDFGVGRTLSFDERVAVLLSAEKLTQDAHIEAIAEGLSRDLHTASTYSVLQKGRALGAFAKGALGTYEDGTALEHACRVSGLDATVGAIVYALCASHGPTGNLLTVGSGLYNIDRQFAASVFVDICLYDPHEHDRARALDLLAARLSEEAITVAQATPRGEEIAAAIRARHREWAEEGDYNPSHHGQPATILTCTERQVLARIVPAMQQVLSGNELAYRRTAIELVEQEDTRYALPMLILATQVFNHEVRSEALRALERIDRETANILKDVAPTFISRITPHESE